MFSFLNALFRLITQKLIKKTSASNNEQLSDIKDTAFGISSYTEQNLKDFIEAFKFEEENNLIESYSIDSYNFDQGVRVKHVYEIWISDLVLLIF